MDDTIDVRARKKNVNPDRLVPWQAAIASLNSPRACCENQPQPTPYQGLKMQC